MENQQACVWATSKEHWDSFLNDPVLSRALDRIQNTAVGHVEESERTDNPPQPSESSASDDGPKGQRIGARLRAYETPITDEILRQSIR